MVAGGVIEAEYDVPPDAWYFAADRQPAMPFAVLLEVGLAAVRLAGGLHRLGADQPDRPLASATSAARPSCSRRHAATPAR